MPARELWQRLESRSRSNLYFALLFLPPDRREAFRDVYRFLRAADDVSDSPELSEARKREALTEVRHELGSIFAGTATHPDALRLSATVRRLQLPRAHFDTILSALEEDIPPRHFASRAQLERWCERMSSTLAYLCLELLGARGAAARAYARDMGVALQLGNILRDVREDATRAHLYLPVDELAAAGTSPDDVLAGRSSAGLSLVCASLAARTRQLVLQARSHLGGMTRDARTALLVPEIWADVYLAQLDQLALAGHDPFAPRAQLKKRTRMRIAMTRWVRFEAHRAARLLLPQA